jgi:dethiobiotin synthetase
MTKRVFVTGIGTEVGKTVVSAVLRQGLSADYWKPVQSGDLHHSDSDKIREWTQVETAAIHPETYRLNTAASPHASAVIDGVKIRLSDFHLPQTNNFLVTEGAGGLMVPLNDQVCILDLIEALRMPVVLVSRHYLGSINHTLLSLEALRRRSIPVAGLVFNGEPEPATESAIEQFGGITPLFRLDPLPEINRGTIRRAAQQWSGELEKWRAGLVI